MSSLSKDHWNRFILDSPTESFLQSYDWGVFQESLGRKVWRLKQQQIQALIIKYKLPFGKSYFYCPRGPIVDFLKIENQKPIFIFQKFLAKVRKIAEKEKAIFFRIDPEWLGSKEMAMFLKRLGFRKAPKEVQPKDTLILNLRKPEEELLKEMHPKTRYNIGLAVRKGVKVSKRQSIKGEDFREIWQLFQETAKRDKFRLHPKEYYERMLGTSRGGTVLPLKMRARPFSRTSIELFVAIYHSKIIAANIVVFFGNRAAYLHGVSSYEYRNLMAPYILHWETIKEAKRRGYTEYDFWGISEKNWPGITRFKKGFGGSEVHYIGAYDFVFNLIWYQLYRGGRNAVDFFRFS